MEQQELGDVLSDIWPVRELCGGIAYYWNSRGITGAMGVKGAMVVMGVGGGTGTDGGTGASGATGAGGGTGGI